MRFVLFKGLSQYGSLRLHIDDLGQALARLGHDVRIADLVQDPALLDEIGADPPDCCFGLNGVAAQAKAPSGSSLFDQMGVVYASLYLDHPLHHQVRLAEPIGRHVALFLDRSHVQFLAAMPKARPLTHVGFLPPGASELPEPVDVSEDAFRARDIPLLFTGTYRGEPEAGWTEWDPSPARDVVIETVDRMIADGKTPILDALKASLGARGAGLSPQLFAQLLPVLRAPQAYVEAYQRNALLQALGRHGAPLHVYGNGWDPLVSRYPSFSYGGVGSVEETLHLLRRTRVVLNTNNGFVAGGHERVFSAMCAGAAVFSDASRFYADAFKEGREIATFAWNRLDAAPEQLSALLQDVPKLAAQASAGHRRATAEHRWSDRAAKLVKVVKSAR